jgi:hypothetical protein
MKGSKKNLTLHLDMALTLTPQFENDIIEINSTDFSQTRKKHIPCRRELLVMSLQKFYNGVEDIDKLVDTMQGNGTYSLRLIDVFVTNYAKKHNTSYMLNNQDFLVYLNYKSQTKAYSKKLFDPFCRRERILFQCAHKEPFVTTVGQLNFFRWAYEKGILKYIEEHVEEIRNEEKESRKAANGSQNSTASSASTISIPSSGTTRRRRTEKIPANMKLIHKYDVEVVMSFD